MIDSHKGTFSEASSSPPHQRITMIDSQHTFSVWIKFVPPPVSYYRFLPVVVDEGLPIPHGDAVPLYLVELRPLPSPQHWKVQEVLLSATQTHSVQISLIEGTGALFANQTKRARKETDSEKIVIIHTHTTILVTSLNSTASIKDKFVGIPGLKPSGIYVYTTELMADAARIDYYGMGCHQSYMRTVAPLFS